MTKWEYQVLELSLSEKWRPKKQREELDRFRAELNAHPDLRPPRRQPDLGPSEHSGTRCASMTP